MAVKKTGTAKKIQSQGIGESKLFGGQNEKDMSYMEGTTVNGEPLPPDCYATFPYSLTDQGKAEMEIERKNLPVSYAGRDGAPFDYAGVADDDKKLEKFRDDLKTAPPQRQSRDALRQLMDKNLPKGHRGLWMGKRKTDEAGMFRDELEYQPVLVKNPTTGIYERVQAGGMFLASVSEEAARGQERLNEARAKERQVSADEKVREQSERIMGTGELNELARRRRTLEDLGGSHEDDPDVAMSEIMAHEGA